MAVEQPSEGSDAVGVVGVGFVVLKSGPDTRAQVFWHPGIPVHSCYLE